MRKGLPTTSSIYPLCDSSTYPVCTHEFFYRQDLCSSVESTDWTVFWGYANLSEDLPHHQFSSLYKAGAAWYVSLTTPRPATIMQREVSEQ
jgi:hypothetical protein